MVGTIDSGDIPAGADVYTADDEKLGTVAGVEQGALIVEKGMFFPASYAIPLSAVASVADDRVSLNVGKDAALAEEWGAASTAGATTTATTGLAAASETDATVAETGDPAWSAPVGGDEQGMVEDTGAAFEHRQDSDRTHENTADGLRVEIHEEELTATTRPREIGEILIEKEVVTEERTIDVPVTEERLRVARHVVDRPPAEGDTPFDGGKIEIPIMGEEVALETEVRVAEEVEIGKETVERTEQVTGTVRREEVRLRETGGATISDDTEPTRRSDRTDEG